MRLTGVDRFGRLQPSALSRMPGVQFVSVADPDPRQLATVPDLQGATTLHHQVLARWPRAWRPAGAMAGVLDAVGSKRPSTTASRADAVQGLRIAKAIIESARLGPTLQLGC